MFRIDSRFYQLSTKFYELARLNVLFLLTGIFLIPLGSAIVALMVALRTGESGTSVFFKRVRQNILATIPVMGFNLISASFLSVAYTMMQQNASQFIQLVWVVFVCFLIAYNMNLYLVMALFEYRTLYSLFAGSFFLTVLSFPEFLIVFLGALLMVFVSLPYLFLMVLCLTVSLPLWVYMMQLKKEMKVVERLYAYTPLKELD